MKSSFLKGAGCGCGGCLLGVVVFVIAIFIFIFSMFKQSTPFKDAVRIAGETPEVIETLGEPVTAGWLPTGNINISNDEGTANLKIPISGPNGSGTIRVEGVKQDGDWSYTRLEVQLDEDDSTINLLDGGVGDDSGEDAVVKSEQNP